MLDPQKVIKKMLGSDNRFFSNINIVNSSNMFRASVNKQQEWKRKSNIEKNVMRMFKKDTDRDGVPDEYDCRGLDPNRHGGHLMWEKMKEKGIYFMKQGVKKDDPDLAKGKEAYIEKEMKRNERFYGKGLDKTRARKYAEKKYEREIRERDIPRITKKEKKQVRRAFEKSPELLEQARDTTIYVRDPEDYKIEVKSKEEEEAKRRSNIQVVPRRKKDMEETVWRDSAEDPHQSPLEHFQEADRKKDRHGDDPYTASELKIAPELLHKGIVGKTHSPQTARAIYKLPLRQSKDGAEVVVKQDELLKSAEPVKESDYKIKGSRVAGVMAHELKGRYQLYEAKGPAEAMREGKVPEPKSKSDYVKDYKYDPRDTGINIEKEEAAKKKVLGMREENILSPEEITRLDELQRTGKITKDQREKVLTHIEKKYRNVSIHEKFDEGYTGKDKTFGRLVDAFAEVGAGRIVDPTTIQARHRFAAQFKEREKVPEKVGTEKFKTMMDKGPVKPILKKEPEIRPGYSYTKLPKDLLSEDTIKKAEEMSTEGLHSPQSYLLRITWERRLGNITQSQYAEFLTDAVNDPQISNKDYVWRKDAYLNLIRDALEQKKITKEQCIRELRKTIKEYHKTPGYYKEKSKIMKESFKLK